MKHAKEVQHYFTNLNSWETAWQNEVPAHNFRANIAEIEKCVLFDHRLIIAKCFSNIVFDDLWPFSFGYNIFIVSIFFVNTACTLNSIFNSFQLRVARFKDRSAPYFLDVRNHSVHKKQSVVLCSVVDFIH